MATYITHVRLSPPSCNDRQHISEVRWSQPGQTNECTRAAMVDFVNKGNAVFVHGSPDAKVGVVNGSPPYLRTHADGNWTNNRLSLPRFCRIRGTTASEQREGRVAVECRAPPDCAREPRQMRSDASACSRSHSRWAWRCHSECRSWNTAAARCPGQS
jgi:uracil-DNA glycosylase